MFFTDSGRTVKDAGGIEPDVVVKAPELKMLSRELYRRDAFFQVCPASLHLLLDQAV